MNKKSLIKKIIIILVPIYIIFGLGYLPSFIGNIIMPLNVKTHFRKV